jgi:hypothetical protein
MNRFRWIAVAIVVVVAWSSACNDNDLGPDKKDPKNRPPETILASGPPDSVGPGGPFEGVPGTNYKVHMFWSGSDHDGTIDHYDFIMVDHPAIGASISPDDTNHVVVTVPLPDDPRWTATTANDSLFITRADTLRRDPQPGPGEVPGDVQEQSFERWHTFFVRAVDNEGLPDPTPEYRSFNSTTLAPTVGLKSPVKAGAEFNAPEVVIFNWDGSDPVGDGSFQAPIASRWARVASKRDVNGIYEGFPEKLYALQPGDGVDSWSPWRRWDAADGSGRRAIVRGLEPTGSGGGYYIFAVQAMDDAGAVTPVFDDQSGFKNNATTIFVSGAVGPDLIVEDRFLGTFTFSEKSVPQVLDVAAGQAIRFRWRGDASRYGGEVVAYRYGWNISNPNDDEQWEQSWSSSARNAEVRVFNSGTQRFFLEARDNAETITRARFSLVVQRVTRERELLLVDDTIQPQPEREGIEDRRWAAVIDSLVLRRPFSFDRVSDNFDIESPEARNNPPPLSKVFRYKTVIWTTIATQGAALRTLAAWFDPFVDRNEDRLTPFNYLNIYIENKGELWITGEAPAQMLWPLGEGNIAIHDQLPVNVTNWDDPVQPHPEQDSVGTSSFIYKMGVEAFDLGGGNPRSIRQTLDHACVGLRRATPQGWELQSFTSTDSAGHSHTVELRTSDVEAIPLVDQVYSTDRQAEHDHTVLVTAAHFAALRRGDRVLVTTSPSDLPETHTHVFDLVDQLGLWGAPALTVDASWPNPADPNANPWRGRSNIEIYNMPTYLTSRQPPLAPPAWRSVVVYTYVSGVGETAQRQYPATGDNQPVFILARAQSTDAFYSRAWCGFEAYVLALRSHVALADFVLLRHMRLGLPEGS